MVTKLVFVVIAGLLLIHQGAAALFSWRFIRLYGQKRVPRDPNDGIGKAGLQHVSPAYIRSLIAEGYAAYNDFDLVTVIDLLLEPHRYNLRITEEIVPDQPVAKHKVIRDVHLGKTSRHTPFVMPVADFPKGVLLDGLEVTVNSNPARVMSYDESLRFTAALLFTARLAEYYPDAHLKSSGGVEFPIDKAISMKFRDQLARDMYEVVRPAQSLTYEERRTAQQGAISKGEQNSGLSRAEALVARLRANYVLYTVLDEPKAVLGVAYSRSTAIHGKDTTVSHERRAHNWMSELRFRLGQFPFLITVTTSLIYKCQSYHLRTTLPTGLCLYSHDVYERKVDGSLEKRQQQDFVHTPQVESWEDEHDHFVPTYMRTRDHRALPYAHFYARNGYHMARLLHTHVLRIGEVPFATLRLASTLLLLAAIGLTITGVILVGADGTYSLRSGVLAIIVSVPGVLASWSRQVFGVESLHRSCLTTQFALRLTTALSLVGLALAVLQDGGLLQWSVDLRLVAFSEQIPIRDGVWICLCTFAWLAAVFVWCLYHKRRMQYLALRRRSLVSLQNSPLE